MRAGGQPGSRAACAGGPQRTPGTRMDTSSIVSFTHESAGRGGGREASAYSLAVHALRDRCLLLQRRIRSLEHDNLRLKLDRGAGPGPGPGDEPLRRRVAELTEQKSQLMHHVLMVTCENRSLWSRIAGGKPSEDTPPRHARLLRTNTYIHSTPKTGNDKLLETSLEEISLKLIDSYIKEKSQLVEQYEQMTELQDSDVVLNLDSISFAYLDDQGSDSLKEIRTQTEKLIQLKKELSKQETDLMLILNNVENFLSEGRKCTNCMNSSKPISEHKEIATSDSLAEWVTPANSNTYEQTSELTTSQSVNKKDASPITEVQQNSNDQDKICPMCGQGFKKGSSFAEFQQHVENHFLGDPEPDSIADNYELINHSVDTNYL